jgi:O-antigen ligase
MINLFELLLTWGTVLTTATQLRPKSLPIGIGEGMLALWMIAIVLKIINSRNYPINPICKIFSLFWLVAIVCLILGFFIAAYLDVVSIDFTYNTVALGFACLFSITFSLYLVEVKNFNKLVIWLISFAVISQLIILLFPSLLPGVQPWYGGIRFAGWSKNPNQVAILLCIMPFFLLHLFSHGTKNKLTKFWCVFLTIISIIIGILTDSDALKNSWLSGLGILMLLKSNTWIANLFSNNKIPLHRLIYTNIFRLFFVLFILMNIFLSLHQEQVIISDVYNKDSQGNIRFILWVNGLIAISYSPLFGLGPGFFSGISGPFFDFEAHNTFIDWTASSGIIGLVSYLGLLAWIAWNAWKRQLLILFSAVISLVGFSSFHYVLRQPIFWFYLLSIAWWSSREPIMWRGEKLLSKAQSSLKLNKKLQNY